MTVTPGGHPDRQRGQQSDARGRDCWRARRPRRRGRSRGRPGPPRKVPRHTAYATALKPSSATSAPVRPGVRITDEHRQRRLARQRHLGGGVVGDQRVGGRAEARRASPAPIGGRPDVRRGDLRSRGRPTSEDQPGARRHDRGQRERPGDVARRRAGWPRGPGSRGRRSRSRSSRPRPVKTMAPTPQDSRQGSTTSISCRRPRPRISRNITAATSGLPKMAEMAAAEPAAASTRRGGRVAAGRGPARPRAGRARRRSRSAAPRARRRRRRPGWPPAASTTPGTALGGVGPPPSPSAGTCPP